MDMFKEHPQLFRVFVFIYGAVGATSAHFLQQSIQADPKRFTIQKALLGLATCTCFARCFSYYGNIEWDLPFFAGNLLNSLVYLNFFSLHSVLAYFFQEFARVNWVPEGKYRGLSFLYPFDFLHRFKPLLIYFNLVTFLYTYFALCMIHAQPTWSFLPAFVGSSLHTLIYLTFAAHSWNFARVFPKKPSNEQPGTFLQVFWLPYFLAWCLICQAFLTIFPLFGPQIFFRNFVGLHSAFFVAEVSPIIFLIYFLREKPSHYFVTVAAAA